MKTRGTRGARFRAGFRGKKTTQDEKIESLEWVPQSPDLNLIEALWGDIEVELGEKYIDTVMRRVKEEWGSQSHVFGL